MGSRISGFLKKKNIIFQKIYNLFSDKCNPHCHDNYNVYS